MNRLPVCQTCSPHADDHAPSTPHPANRGHRRLVRLGWALLFIGPALTVMHLIIDAQRGGAGTVWTYTILSGEVGVIATIIGVALVFREPRGARHDSR